MFLDTGVKEKVSRKKGSSWNRLPFTVTLLVLVSSLLILTGCNKQSRYRVLNTLFDGVPHPDDVLTAEEMAAREAPLDERSRLSKLRPLTIRYRHPSGGSAAGECSLCHGDTKALVIPGKDMCVKCHSQVKEKRAFIHGPAVLDCIVCHDPHESKAPSLLKVIGNELCFACHYRQNREDAYKAEAHKEVEGKEFLCLDCHDPHGGNDRFFVKEVVRVPEKKIEEENLMGKPPLEEEIQYKDQNQEELETENIQ